MSMAVSINGTVLFRLSSFSIIIIIIFYPLVLRSLVTRHSCGVRVLTTRCAKEMQRASSLLEECPRDFPQPVNLASRKRHLDVCWKFGADSALFPECQIGSKGHFQDNFGKSRSSFLHKSRL